MSTLRPVSTAVAIEWALAPAAMPRKLDVATILRSARASLRGRWFRARHRELALAVNAAVDEIAGVVLRSENRSMLELALDQQATGQSVIRALEALSSLNEPSTLRRLAQARPRATDWEWVGSAAAKHMALGNFYANEVALAIANIVETHGRDYIESWGKPGPDILDFLTNRDVHADVADALLATYRSIVCLLVIGGSKRLGISFEPWLALDLAERFAHGQRQHLRLLASLPGFSVPEDVIPASERFDLDKLRAESREADERLRTMTIDPGAYIE